MSAPRPHLIRTQALHVAVARPDHAERVLAVAAGLARDRLPAETDAIFSRHCPSGRTLRLSRIELNLGTIPEERFARDFPERFRAALEEDIKRRMRSQFAEAETAAGSGAENQVPRLALLLHVLQHGHRPWWAGPEPDFDPPKELVALLASAPNEVCAGLRRIGRQRVVRHRLVRWLDDPGIARLVQALAPAAAPFILAYAADLDRRQQQEPLVAAPAAEFRQAKWEIILGHLLADPGSHFNAKAFLRQTLQALAARFRLAYAELLGELVRSIETLSFDGSESSLLLLLGELHAEEVSRVEEAEPPDRRPWLALWSARLHRPGENPPAGAPPLEFWRTLPPAESRAVLQFLVNRHGAAALAQLLTEVSPADGAALREILSAGEETGLTPALPETDDELTDAEAETAPDAIAALRALLVTGRLPRHPAWSAWHDHTAEWLGLTLARHAGLVAPLFRQWARQEGFIAGIVRRQPEPVLALLLEVVWPRYQRAAIALLRLTGDLWGAGPVPVPSAAERRLRVWQVILEQVLDQSGVSPDLAAVAAAVVREWAGGPMERPGAAICRRNNEGPAPLRASAGGPAAKALDPVFSSEGTGVREREVPDELDALRTLLETGRLPPISMFAAWQDRAEEWLRRVLARPAIRVAPLLREWARQSGFVSGVLQRQSATRLEMLIAAGWPQHHRAALALVRLAETAAARLRLWQALLVQLLTGSGATSEWGAIHEALAGMGPSLGETGVAGTRDGPAIELKVGLAASPLLRLRLLAVLLRNEEVGTEVSELFALYAGADNFSATERSAAGWWELLAEAVAGDDTTHRHLRTTVWTVAGVGEALRSAAGGRLLAAALFAGESAQAEWWRDALGWLEISPAAAALIPGGRGELQVRLWVMLAQLVREDGGRPVRDAAGLLIRALARLGLCREAGSSRGEREQAVAARLAAALRHDGGSRARRLAESMGLASSRRAEATKTPALPEPRPDRSRPRAQEAERDEAEPIWIDNAGLVLVAPFLPRLFARCGYLADGEFAGGEATHRAVHLTQYLVSGAAERWHEFNLTLNKVLCGLEPAAAVVDAIELTREECAAAEGLLEFCATQWPRGAAVSPAGLRASYLRRPGKLSTGEEHWRLQVEKRGWDVLLPELPWTFPGPAPQWMPRPLRVEWI